MTTPGDLTLAYSDAGVGGDLVLTAADLLTGDDLRTNIAVSLLTLTGWWANAYEPTDWGCRVLDLRRAKHSNDTLLKARDYCRQALRWLIEDRVAKSVDVLTAWQGDLLGIDITVTQATGVTRYSFVWNAI